MTSVRDAALEYAARGWRVFPLHSVVNGTCTCGHARCASPGKHPLVRRGLHDATVDEALVAAWWRGWRRANIGLVTGAESGIAVVDVDLPAAIASLDGLIEAGIGTTLTGLTGGGGVHLFYSCADGALGNTAGRLPGLPGHLPGVDLRANGGYVVAPPSIHRSGTPYTWLDPTRDIAPSPPWLRQPRRVASRDSILASPSFPGDGTAYGQAVLRDELAGLRGAPVGRRNQRLNRAAFLVGRVVGGGELREDVARAALLRSALELGLGEGEARQTIESGLGAGVANPRVAPHRLRSA